MFHLSQLEHFVQHTWCIPFQLPTVAGDIPERSRGLSLARRLQTLPAVRVALAVYGDEVSPRFCYCPDAMIVDWDGRRATRCGSVHLGSCPYPLRLERLADLSVTWLVCGSFPREHLHEAGRYGIRVSCGAAGPIPTTPAALARFLVRMRGNADA